MDRDYGDSSFVGCFNWSTHAWYSSGSSDKDCGSRCYYFISSCSWVIDPDRFTSTCIYRGSAWQLRVRGGHFSVLDHSTLICTRLDCFRSSFGPLAFWQSMPKEERVDSGGVAREGFVSLCATFMHHVYVLMFIFTHLHYVTCVLMRYLSYLLLTLSLLYHVTWLVLAHKVLLPCLTLISYELCFCVLTLLVLPYEYTLLA
jgi:hypothetical protein